MLLKMISEDIGKFCLFLCFKSVCSFIEIKPASTLDLREDGTNITASSMGDRSKSVPGLNAVS